MLPLLPSPRETQWSGGEGSGVGGHLCRNAPHPGSLRSPTLPATRYARGGRMKSRASEYEHQYVARPPEISNTAPVEKEHSADTRNATSAAISPTSTKRPRGILDSM